MDGTLLPCWSWASRLELHSGKHKTTGVKLLVACTLSGDLAWISDPVDGSLLDAGTRQSRSCGLKQLDRALRVAGVVAVGGGDIGMVVQA